MFLKVFLETYLVVGLENKLLKTKIMKHFLLTLSIFIMSFNTFAQFPNHTQVSGHSLAKVKKIDGYQPSEAAAASRLGPDQFYIQGAKAFNKAGMPAYYGIDPVTPGQFKTIMLKNTRLEDENSVPYRGAVINSLIKDGQLTLFIEDRKQMIENRPCWMTTINNITGFAGFADCANLGFWFEEQTVGSTINEEEIQNTVVQRQSVYQPPVQQPVYQQPVYQQPVYEQPAPQATTYYVPPMPGMPNTQINSLNINSTQSNFQAVAFSYQQQQCQQPKTKDPVFYNANPGTCPDGSQPYIHTYKSGMKQWLCRSYGTGGLPSTTGTQGTAGLPGNGITQTTGSEVTGDLSGQGNGGLPGGGK